MFYSRKRITIILALAGLVLLTAGIIYTKNLASYTANLDTRPLNVGLAGEVENLAPALLSNPQERLVASSMYEGLVYYDEDTKSIKPCLAKSWKYSADGKSITLNISGTRFHNGKPVTAKDVKASWENNFSTTKDWANISLFLSIVGTMERLEGKSAEITGIEVVNNHKLKVNFEKPNSAFIYMLTNPIFWIYDTEDKVEIAPGTGPFIFKERKEDKSIILLKNEKYHQGEPALAALNVCLYNNAEQALGDYQAGRLDFIDTVPVNDAKTIKKDNKYKGLYIEKPLLDIYCIGINMNREPFAGNYNLRRAINYGIDRQAIIDNVLGGTYKPLKGIIPSGIAGYSTEMRGYTYDRKMAADLLEKAEHPMGEGLKPIVLTYNKDEGHRMVAESIAQQLAELGIQVQPQPMDWEYYKKQLGKMELEFFRLGWHADYPDADSFLYSLFHSSKIGISNYCGYHNVQVDKILDASRGEIKSQQERIKLLKRAEEVIVDDAPCLLLFQKKTNMLVGRHVKSLEVNCMGLIDWAQIELLKPSVEDEKEPSSSTQEV